MQKEEEEEETRSNLGTLFWDTASALPDHTAIHYQGGEEKQEPQKCFLGMANY